MDIVLKVIQVFFYLLASCLFLGFIFSRHLGTLFASVIFGGGAYASFIQDSWWPLLAAFAVAWVLRLLGLDPSTD